MIFKVIILFVYQPTGKYYIGIVVYEIQIQFKDCTKEEVMEWMLDIQLGRRNLSPIQRIAITEKYRPIYEKQARESQGTRNDLKDNIPQNIGESEKRRQAKDREVNSKLAKVANVNPETYRQAKRILDSNNEDLKQRVQSGEMSINAGYKNGEIGRNHFQDSHNEKAEKLTLDEIAKELNISKSNLTRALSIERNLTDSMKEHLIG